ncbi:hypothetical protein VNO78_30391 [Psophocarpus tetragonolobus]|uniref:adenine phosphoribosyltransferase n=1 Tax=Psophocarpus tetragonolobus TaxID=3891 RepID=A0AAN9X516_PSOTE
MCEVPGSLLSVQLADSQGKMCPFYALFDHTLPPSPPFTWDTQKLHPAIFHAQLALLQQSLDASRIQSQSQTENTICVPNAPLISFRVAAAQALIRDHSSSQLTLDTWHFEYTKNMSVLGNGANKVEDPRLQAVSEAIRVVPHFPKQGIMFQDITTLLLDHNAFKDAVEIFVDRYRDMNISVVAGVEARGFIFGSSIALGIGAKFVPLCKPGKLPGKVISEKYILEYGTDCLEMHVGAVQPHERVIIIDDLVATGGTLSAAIRLLELAGAEVVECACVIGLSDLKVRCKLNGKPLYILVEPRQVGNGF